MSEFLRRMSEELRSREKFLEDHNDHPVLSEGGDDFRKKYEDLVGRLKGFSDRVNSALEKGEDIHEKFEDEISDENQTLKVEFETFSKSFRSSDQE